MNDLYDLVCRAKRGDKDAMERIVEAFRPVIRKASRGAKGQERDDLEQELTEKMIRAVYAYDLESVPDFTAFCREVCEGEETGGLLYRVDLPDQRFRHRSR